MPELIGYSEDGTPQYSFSDEDKLKGISVRPHNALLDPAPVEAAQPEQSALPVDITGIGAVPNQTTGFATADKLFGLNGQERFQTWPERMVRSGVSLAHDVMTGELPVTTLRREDVTDIPAPQGATADSPLIGRLLNLSPVAADPRDPLIERAQDMAGLAGGATLGINPAEMTVASGMTKMAKNGPITVEAYKGAHPTVGGPSYDWKGNVIDQGTPEKLLMEQEPFKSSAGHAGFFSSDPSVASRFAKVLSKDGGTVFPVKIKFENPLIIDGNGKPAASWQFESVAREHQMQDAYKQVQDALKDNQYDGIIVKNTKDEGDVYIPKNNTQIQSKFKLTPVEKNVDLSNLFSDTQKPGMALSALEKPAPVFYSALENAVNNITANKMPADQWLGTLTNAKGVRPEEMEWTGLKDFLAEQKGPVTKDQVQQYLDANKVELKEVNKGESNYYRPVYKETLPRRMADFEPILKEINSIEDVGLAQKHNIAFKETTRGYDKEQILEAVQEAKNIPKYEEIAGKSFDTEAEALQAIKDANAENHLQINPVNEYKDIKFSQYVLPGAENYRETLLTLPAKRPSELKYTVEADPKIPNKFNVYRIIDGEKELYNTRATKAEAEKDAAFGQANDKITNRYVKDTFKSSHWDEPNVLAHVRMNDRTIDGKKSLHLEEIQSDWHQIARDKGYAVSADKIEKLRPQFDKIDEKLLNSNDEQLLGHPEVDGMLKMAVDKKIITPDEAKIYKQVSDTSQTGAVPDAPFKKTWHELVLKRMLREAAEKGYSRLSWTPGEAQAARYDLSKEINRLSYNPKTEKLYAYKGDSAILDGETVPKEKIADYVGKGVAQRLLESKPSSVGNAGVPIHSLEGESLKINPEEARGMNTFYNMMIPKALEKIGKEHGVKVKEGEIVNPVEYAAWKELNQNQKTEVGDKSLAFNKVHYIDIPQSLKGQALRKGFPLFSSGVMLSPVENNPFDNQSKLTPVDGNPFE